MEQPTELDDPSDLSPPDLAGSGGCIACPADALASSTASLRELLANERSWWSRLDENERCGALREAIGGRRSFEIETLVHIVRLAFTAGNRKLLNLAFEALIKVASPLLFSQAWGLDRDQRKSQVQEILMHTFEKIRAGKAAFAETNFASFALRKSISLYRSRQARFEGANERIEPSDTFDPLDLLPDRLPSAEDRALVRRALDRLSSKHRGAFIQYHLLGLTQDEIAAQHEVDASTIRYWLRRAKDALGLSGDEHDR